MLTIAKLKFFNRHLPLALIAILLSVGFGTYFIVQKSKKAESAWFSSSATPGSWNYRQKITIDHTKVGQTLSQNLTDFPVLISTTNVLFKSVSNGGHVGLDTGYDIVFTAADGVTKLNHEIEKYEAATGTLISWVKIPTLYYQNDTIIYMYYGNAAETGNEQNPTAVWSNGYAGVWHLPNGSILNTNDSTSNGYNMTNDGPVSATGGKIDGASGSFNGGTNRLYYTNSSITSKTISAWIKFSTSQTVRGIIFNNAANYHLLAVGTRADSFSTIPSTLASAGKQTTTTYNDGQWHYVVALRDSNQIYVDGTAATMETDTNNYSSVDSGVTEIGTRQDGASRGFVDGYVDEVRIMGSELTPDWIKTEYNNQNSPSTFSTFGGEESQPTPQVKGSWYSGYYTPAFVQGKTNVTWAGNTVTDTMDSNVTAGNVLAVFVAWESKTNTMSSLTATCVAGGNLTIAKNLVGVNAPLSIAMAYGVVNASGACSVTANFSGNQNDRLVVHEVSGINITSPLDVTGAYEAAWGSPATSGNVTTNYSGGYIFGVSHNTGGIAYTVGNGFTLRFGGANGYATEDQAQASAGQIAATFGLASSAAPMTGIMAFKPAPDPDAWGYRKKLAINHTQVSGTSTLSSFPVLVSVTDAFLKSTSNGGHMASTTAADLLFTSADGTTKIPHEIEKYDPATGQLIAWVKTNVSPSADTILYMYYGNSNITVSQEDKANVWDSNYKGVWHMNNGTASTTDSTINANTGSNVDVTDTAGQINGAGSFNGSSSTINAGSGSSLDDIQNQGGGGMTVDFWINSDVNNGTERIISKGLNSANSGLWAITKSNNTNPARIMFNKEGATDFAVNWNSVLATGTLTHLAVVWNGGMNSGDVNLYKNGILQSGAYTVGATANTDADNNLCIGSGNCAGTYFDGSLDEIRISNIQRSVDWIKTEYNNQNSPSGFVSVMGEESSTVATFNTTWYSSDWGYRKKITIDKNKVAGPLTDFPVLVSLTDNDLKTYAQATGNDIMFTSSDGLTKLNHEIETYASSTGQLIAWVKVPNLSNTSDTTLYMYFGNATVTSQANPTAVWDEDFKGVWHLNQASSPALDSTSNGNNAATSVGLPTFDSVGQISKATTFNPAANLVTSAVVTNATDNFTMSAWIKPASSIWNGAVTFYNGDANSNGWGLIAAGGATQWGVFYRAQGGANFGALTFNKWQMVAIVRRSGVSYGYVNGVEYNLGNLATPGVPTTGTYLGSGSSSIGTIDEARISTSARSAEWIRTEYNNQSSAQTFYMVGGLEATNRPAQVAGVKSASRPIATGAINVDENHPANAVIGLVRQDCAGYSNCWTSLSAWQTGMLATTTSPIGWGACAVGDLTCVNKIAIAKIDGEWTNPDTVAVRIQGWTTDANYYIKIYTTAQARHDGKWNTNKYRLDSNNIGWAWAVLHISEYYVRVDGLQINFASDSHAVSGIRSEAASSRISNNIIKGGSNTYKTYGIYSDNYHDQDVIWNNIIYDVPTGIRVDNSNVGLTVKVNNNTIQNCTTGINAINPGSRVAKNNLIRSCATAASGTFANGTDYNATDNADMGYTVTGGGNSYDRVLQTFSFANEGGDNFHLSSTDTGAKGWGANLYSTFTNDIDGQGRPAAGWDIGADQTLAATKVKLKGGVKFK